jgi:hypothetical protein
MSEKKLLEKILGELNFIGLALVLIFVVNCNSCIGVNSIKKTLRQSEAEGDE